MAFRGHRRTTKHTLLLSLSLSQFTDELDSQNTSLTLSLSLTPSTRRISATYPSPNHSQSVIPCHSRDLWREIEEEKKCRPPITDQPAGHLQRELESLSVAGWTRREIPSYVLLFFTVNTRFSFEFKESSLFSHLFNVKVLSQRLKREKVAWKFQTRSQNNCFELLLFVFHVPTPSLPLLNDEEDKFLTGGKFQTNSPVRSVDLLIFMAKVIHSVTGIPSSITDPLLLLPFPPSSVVIMWNRNRD